MFASASISIKDSLCSFTYVLTVQQPQPAQTHTCILLTEVRHTSPAFKDVIDLSQQQGHVAELRLPGLAEHLQVLLGDLTGRVEGERLGCRDDLSIQSGIQELGYEGIK